MRTELIARFDYGSVMPWVSRQPGERLKLIAGPDRLLLDTKVPLRGKDMPFRRGFDAKLNSFV